MRLSTMMICCHRILSYHDELLPEDQVPQDAQVTIRNYYFDAWYQEIFYHEDMVPEESATIRSTTKSRCQDQ